jgi:hypothetical protein
VLFIAGPAIDIYSIAVATNPIRQTAKVIAGWPGAWVGCELVGTWCAAGGTAVEPGGGTAVPGGGGCIVGGIAGNVYDWAEDTIFTRMPESGEASADLSIVPGQCTFMCALNQMLFCSGFTDAKWALPVDTPVGVRRWLIGWRMSSSPLDGGAPPEVARILASSLVRHARVTFAEGIPRPCGSFKWSFVHTRDAREAERLFDAGCISWPMGSQLAFLSTPSAPPPPFRRPPTTRVSKARSSSAFMSWEAAVFSQRASTGMWLACIPSMMGYRREFSAASKMRVKKLAPGGARSMKTSSPNLWLTERARIRGSE